MRAVGLVASGGLVHVASSSIVVGFCSQVLTLTGCGLMCVLFGMVVGPLLGEGDGSFGGNGVVGWAIGVTSSRMKYTCCCKVIGVGGVI